MGTLERAEEMYEAGQFLAALGLVRDLYGQTLPSSDRGGALALEAVCLEYLDQGEEAEGLIAEVMKEAIGYDEVEPWDIPADGTWRPIKGGDWRKVIPDGR